jgi:hypothetical protein
MDEMKVVSQRTKKLLKNLEIEEKDIVDEICENLEE